MRSSGILAWLVGLFCSSALAAPGDPPKYAEVFTRAFAPGFSVEPPKPASDPAGATETVPLRTVDIGMLTITGNKICAADPFVALGNTKPFTETVPAGSYAVRVAVANFPEGGHRIAFARINFRDAPTVRWQMALIEGQKLSDLGPDEIYGYPVDSGTGSFFDPAIQDAVNAAYKQNPEVWSAWQTEGEANGPKVIGPYSFVLMLPMGPANVAMFHSGWGDGVYASWFGYDADGKVVALVTDFQVIEWDKAKW